MENFALIFIALALGYILQKSGAFSKEAPLVLNQYILYIALPSMALLYIPRLSFSAQTVVPIFIAWAVMAFSALLILVVSKIMAFNKSTTGALLLVGVLGNTSFVGIPLVEHYYTKEALGYLLMYDQLGTFIALSTYGTFVAVYYSNKGGASFKGVLFKIVRFPPFLMLLVALGFVGTTFCPLIISVLEAFSATIVPLALVSVGLSLQFKLSKSDIKPFIVGLATSLVVAPLSAYSMSIFLGLEGLAVEVSILEAAMGPMITAGVLASLWNLSPKLSASIVGYGTIASFGTTAMVYSYLLS